MADRVEIIIPSLPTCPDCHAVAHRLAFRPAVELDQTRILTDFVWHCPQGHRFATTMPDIPLPTWRHATIEDLELVAPRATPGPGVAT